MSLESALEEERLEILKLLERPSISSKSAGAGVGTSPTTPRSPPLVPRTLSPTRASARPGQSIGGISSMILAAERSSNSGSPPPGSLSYTRSRDSSPHGSLHSTTSSSYGGPRLLRDRDRDREAAAFSPNTDYQFNMSPSAPNPGLRRASAGPTGKTSSASASSPTSSPTLAHASVNQAYQDSRSSIYSESGPFQPGGMGLPSGSQIGGRQMRLGSSSKRSGSPSMYHTRSASPSAGNVSLSPLSSPPMNMNMSMAAALNASTGRAMLTENDTIIDLDSAYRRLSDDALRNSGGSLATLPERGGIASHIRANSGESVTRDGGVRLEKDLMYTVNEDGREIAVESSDESDFSSDEDTENFRGRRSEQGDFASHGRFDSVNKLTSLRNSNATLGDAATSVVPQRKTMSLLAAAEEERKSVSSRYKVTSLLPSVTISPPTVTQLNTSKNNIHPNTNFDTRSHVSTPFTSDTEADAKDIKRASKLSLTVSPIVSTSETHRVARTIVRGDIASLQSEFENGKKKQRSYLVATDLSAEAAYALEWTIGTVLRDGDTLLAICAIDEETIGDIDVHKVVSKDGESGSFIGSSSLLSARRKSLDKGKGGKLGASPVRSSSLSRSESVDTNTAAGEERLLQSKEESNTSDTQKVVFPVLSQGTTETSDLKALPSGQVSENGMSNVKEQSKSERERWIATEQITALILKLLRKTKLQVNVIVEVIHCKSPKHLLTEMIDILEPTLVILGSRGRSALKGVLLGSFSNYLVTKSSVPVMVARKKLKKSKYKNPSPRLINNLSSGTARALALAKVD